MPVTLTQLLEWNATVQRAASEVSTNLASATAYSDVTPAYLRAALDTLHNLKAALSRLPDQE